MISEGTESDLCGVSVVLFHSAVLVLMQQLLHSQKRDNPGRYDRTRLDGGEFVLCTSGTVLQVNSNPVGLVVFDVF